jgi:hypothetical protein
MEGKLTMQVLNFVLGSKTRQKRFRMVRTVQVRVPSRLHERSIFKKSLRAAILRPRRRANFSLLEHTQEFQSVG